MKNVFDYNDSLELSPEDKTTVIVRNTEELLKIRRKFPYENIRIRLVLKELDEELIDMLISLTLPFEIVFESDEIKEKDIINLARYKEATGNKSQNKIYLACNIDDKSIFERSELIYLINRYGVIALLNSDDQELLASWLDEIRKYTKRNDVKKLNRSYIGGQKG